MGNGEIACYEQYLLSPQCFQKLSVVDASKWVSSRGLQKVFDQCSGKRGLNVSLRSLTQSKLELEIWIHKINFVYMYVINSGISIGPHIRHEYWCTSQEAESREISISCRNLFLNWCEMNMFNPFPNKPWFLCVCNTGLWKTLWEKEKLLVTSNFSFSHSVFLPVWRTSCYFHQIQDCRLQTISVWKSLKFVVWERVKLNVIMM